MYVAIDMPVPPRSSLESKATQVRRPPPFQVALDDAIRYMEELFRQQYGYYPRWSREELAQAMGVSEAVASRFLSGTQYDGITRHPPPRVLQHWAQLVMLYKPEWGEDFWKERAGYLTYQALIAWLAERPEWDTARELVDRLQPTLSAAWRTSPSRWKRQADDLIDLANGRLGRNDNRVYDELAQIAIAIAGCVQSWELSRRGQAE